MAENGEPCGCGYQQEVAPPYSPSAPCYRDHDETGKDEGEVDVGHADRPGVRQQPVAVTVIGFERCKMEQDDQHGRDTAPGLDVGDQGRDRQRTSRSIAMLPQLRA